VVVVVVVCVCVCVEGKGRGGGGVPTQLSNATHCFTDMVCAVRQDPPQYMEKLLSIHTDYSRIVAVAFNNDPNFSVELDKVSGQTNC